MGKYSSFYNFLLYILKIEKYIVCVISLRGYTKIVTVYHLMYSKKHEISYYIISIIQNLSKFNQ